MVQGKCQLCEGKEFVILCQCFQMKLCSMTVGHMVENIYSVLCSKKMVEVKVSL